MDPRLFLSQSRYILAAVVFGYLVLAGYRSIRRRSEVIGAIVAVTILGRVAIGLALFWTSFLYLPIAPALQLGGGFWLIAPDATGYYEMALGAAEAGRWVPLDHAIPSPFFVDVLALWMRAVGGLPVAGMFLNLCLYVALVAALVRIFKPINEWRRDLPCIIGVAAYSFSPVVLVHSTQPLKDEFSNVLIALACFGVLAARRMMYRIRTVKDVVVTACGIIAVGVATFGIAGIRWYNAVILIGSLALTLAVFAVRWRATPLMRYSAGSVALLMAAWLGFWGGAGPYHHRISADIEKVLAWQPPRDFSRAEILRSGTAAVRRIAAIPFDLATMVQISRTGFLTSGGNSNIVVPLREDPGVGLARTRELEAYQLASAAYAKAMAERELQERRAQEEEARRGQILGSRPPPPRPLPPRPGPRPLIADEFRAVPITIPDHLRAAATGLAIVFVPLSVLKAVSAIAIGGGGAIMAIADFDTLFLDVTTLLVLALLWRRRRAIGDRLPFVIFVLILAATTAMLLGYVVTNYGTLWRLRSLVAVPLWLLVIALSQREETRRTATVAAGLASTVM